jgi:DNA primase
MIPEDTIEQVRDSTDLVGLIGESVSLRRTGADYRGPCPFHGGTNRNFAVIPKKGRYYCFVCHESGDVFSWFMKRMGLNYPDAVREAARRVGITIPDRPERAGPDPHEPLYEAIEVARDWFTRQLLELPDARIAREYLERREIPLETAALLGLGFAPQGKTFLEAMGKLAIEQQTLLAAGLAAQRDDGQVSARFRGRLLFPIHDLRGRAVGFGGRLLAEGEPKYLNSPETEIFHKGKQLYNLHQAKNSIRKEESVILVEGYFDVLRLVLAGVEHVVAPLGTALTPEQGALLKRFAPSAILLYDSDKAGLKATFRAGDELLRHGFRVKVASMPPGEDPDTLVRAGGVDALDQVLRDSVDVFERKILLLERKGYFEGFEHLRDAVDRLLPTIRSAADPITRELYLSLASERTGISKEVLERELLEQRVARPSAGNGEGEQGRPVREGAASSSPPARVRIGPEIQLLKAMFAAPDWIERARSEVDPSLFRSARLREVYLALLGSDLGTAQLPETLSPQAQSAWMRLKESSQALVGSDQAGTFDRASQIIRARPEYEKISSIGDPGEKRKRRNELQRLYPEADRWYSVVRGVRATNRPKGP